MVKQIVKINEKLKAEDNWGQNRGHAMELQKVSVGISPNINVKQKI